MFNLRLVHPMEESLSSCEPDLVHIYFESRLGGVSTKQGSVEMLIRSVLVYFNFLSWSNIVSVENGNDGVYATIMHVRLNWVNQWSEWWVMTGVPN